MDQAEGDGASRTFARDPDTLEVIGDFLVEAEDGLAKADDLLLELERDGFEAERVNAIFRVFHTIKGVAGFVDLRDVATLAHATEALLDELRRRSPGRVEWEVLEWNRGAIELYERQGASAHSGWIKYRVDPEA